MTCTRALIAAIGTVAFARAGFARRRPPDCNPSRVAWIRVGSHAVGYTTTMYMGHLYQRKLCWCLAMGCV